MAQMKEQIKTPEKELSNKEIANLSDAEFKTLVMRMLTGMTEYWCKIEEEVKAMQSEINKNIQGTNREGKEPGTQINNLKQKEERNIHLEQNEETTIQKMKRDLGTSGATLNVPTSESEGEKEEQEVETYLKT